ncbi:hypothetical protein V6W11_09460 [Micromonospora profundi]|uniref:hypothetical protein n=1 Tax=Micromonospora profundi TaxID=1420889 RepID=UPI002FF0D4D6
MRTVTAALRAKGLDETTATLATESGGTVFRVAYARWVASDADASFADLIAEVATELRAITSSEGRR